MDIRSFYSVVNVKAQKADMAKKPQQEKSQPGTFSSFEEGEPFEKDQDDVEYDTAEIISDDDEPSFRIEEPSTPSQSNIQHSTREEDFSEVEPPQSAQTSASTEKTTIQGPECATEGPRQPVLKKYPQKQMGARFRSFRPQWFQ
ncbi:Hypothetical predicted protein [Pelobates cultripes]|uniref:Uncharacterized protein n=1 Tax=Pelobates cultripes TaxID=61616 RepID=A0AAD1R925_PELCU|nr:Hypothetical predicted protein [Pelobates cultripes]